MRLYYEIGVRSFRRATQYRSAYIAGLLTNAFFAAIRSFVYIALYGAGGAVAGFSLNDAISYVWVTQALISIGAGWISADVASTIRTGDVITDMTRPWNFYLYWFSRSTGEKLFNLLLRGASTYILGMLYFAALAPSPRDLLLFSLTVALALVIAFAFSFMVNMTAFWLVEATGVFLIANVVMTFFSGFLIPIAFMPPALQTLANLLPFQSMSGLPAQVLLGQLAGPALLAGLLGQLVWALIMTVAAVLIMRLAMRKLVIQGG